MNENLYFFSLSGLAKRYNLKQDKLSFPFAFNTKANYDYVGEYPSEDYYINFSDGKETREAKKTFVHELRQDKKIFDFKKQILDYCVMDTDLLCEAMTRFVADCFYLQKLVSKSAERSPEAGRMIYLHPFTQ